MGCFSTSTAAQRITSPEPKEQTPRIVTTGLLEASPTFSHLASDRLSLHNLILKDTSSAHLSPWSTCIPSSTYRPCCRDDTAAFLHSPYTDATTVPASTLRALPRLCIDLVCVRSRPIG
ncbi:hypothetical protein CGMCC3_g7278 [Colletotrichum fructicola]|nr:uncharacterized protein CGMCC3_g7278 [Colletotrichum fructicola]KAE9576933.1 hypothetical protein CGMCC3_g7278 [Colletotrichum fructicola]